MVTDEIGLISGLEERAARAWPAAEAEERHGWLFRATSDVTRRANAVFPHADAAIPLADRIADVEEWYRARGLPPRFQVSPAAQPRGLEAALSARGYVVAEGAHVQVAEASDVAAAATSRQADVRVLLRESVDADWAAAYQAAEQYRQDILQVRLGILARIAQPRAFVIVEVGGVPAAVGLAVGDSGWAGLFCIATRPECRRTGAATTVVRTLAQWADAAGAPRLYLQVGVQNAAAIRLYERLGFRTLYTYHYWERLPAI